TPALFDQAKLLPRRLDTATSLHASSDAEDIRDVYLSAGSLLDHTNSRESLEQGMLCMPSRSLHLQRTQNLPSVNILLDFLHDGICGPSIDNRFRSTRNFHSREAVEY